MTHPEAQANDQAALTLEVTSDGVAWLVFDRPGSRVNLLTSGVMLRLDALLGEIEAAAAHRDVRAVVVKSGKDGSFIAGADVNEILDITDAHEATEKARVGQRVLRRLDLLPVPVMASVNGACMGGGTELILACDYRIASDRRETKIGLPEVQLGILPGFGGTSRLPRIVGLRAALDMILTGKALNARRALRVGLLHEAVPTAILEQRTAAVARELAAGRRLPAIPKRRRNLLARALEDTPPGRKLMLDQARKKVQERTGGHYPAPLAIIDTLRDSHGLTLDEALDREARAIGPLIASDVSKNLIHVFHLMEAAKKAPVSAEPRPVERIAVVGAGVMGGGIAQLAAARNIEVRMKDIRADALASGLRHAREIFDAAVRRSRLDKRTAAQQMTRIAPTLEYTGFQATDLVVEAVVERMDVKKQVLADVEGHVGAECVVATNTSSLSVSEMQTALARPAEFCGMHFFNPVHRMPLVEVVRGKETGDTAIATVFACARALGKTPLVVQDGPGFLVNRILAPYLNEAGWLLAEGAPVAQVDRVLKEFGMPMGPFRLLDEVGLDIARHAGETMHSAFGDRMRPAPPLVALQKTELLGKKGGRGFYTYDKDKEKGVNEQLGESLGGAVAAERRDIDDADVLDRLVLIMVNEAAYILADGIVSSAGAVDLGMITGTGFPPFRGGLLRYADVRGLAALTARLDELAGRHGPRFTPAPRLREIAASGGTFYSAHPA